MASFTLSLPRVLQLDPHPTLSLPNLVSAPSRLLSQIQSNLWPPLSWAVLALGVPCPCHCCHLEGLWGESRCTVELGFVYADIFRAGFLPYLIQPPLSSFPSLPFAKTQNYFNICLLPVTRSPTPRTGSVHRECCVALDWKIALCLLVQFFQACAWGRGEGRPTHQAVRTYFFSSESSTSMRLWSFSFFQIWNVLYIYSVKNTYKHSCTYHLDLTDVNILPFLLAIPLSLFTNKSL